MNWLSALVITAVLGSTNALAASAQAVPHDLQKAADCMYKILKKEPGFENAKLGIYEIDGLSLPYLQYLSPPDSLGRRITVTFEAQPGCTAKRGTNCCGDKKRFCFIAFLNGLSSINGPEPPDGDSGVIAKKWEAQCNVDTFALTI